MTAMSYGHAERNLAAIRLLERQADELLDELRRDDPRAWRRALDADEVSTVRCYKPRSLESCDRGWSWLDSRRVVPIAIHRAWT